MIKETHSFPLTSSIRPANNAAGACGDGGLPSGVAFHREGAVAAGPGPVPKGKAGGPRGGLGRGGHGPPCSRWARQRFSMGCVLTAAWVPPWPRSSAGSY